MHQTDRNRSIWKSLYFWRFWRFLPKADQCPDTETTCAKASQKTPRRAKSKLPALLRAAMPPAKPQTYRLTATTERPSIHSLLSFKTPNNQFAAITTAGCVDQRLGNQIQDVGTVNTCGEVLVCFFLNHFKRKLFTEP